EDQVRRALNGAYSPLGNRGMYGWWLSSIRDVLTDEAETLEQNIINHYFFNYNNTDIRLFNRTNGDGLWNSLYMGVLRSNLIIVRLPQSRIANAQVRGQLMGEAKFLRALYYFHLVN
ncbi:RagB/SusD family nutrient uptake outer membrane protein, partial [Arthrospira platensis SPKY1]|nr:RagB/SusD family nutrient uptake outer membrane protein [Arthrospira platensis SPKY1]